MRNLLERAIYVSSGDESASNLEFIAIASITFVIATVLFLLRDKIMGLFDNVIGVDGTMTNTGNEGFHHVKPSGNLLNGGEA